VAVSCSEVEEGFDTTWTIHSRHIIDVLGPLMTGPDDNLEDSAGEQVRLLNPRYSAAVICACYSDCLEIVDTKKLAVVPKAELGLMPYSRRGTAVHKSHTQE
jgi:hypothetical protein